MHLFSLCEDAGMMHLTSMRDDASVNQFTGLELVHVVTEQAAFLYFLIP